MIESPTVVEPLFSSNGNASMQGEHSSQNSFFGMVCEDLIPADHLLRKLSAAVGLSFVSELFSDCYYADRRLC